MHKLKLSIEERLLLALANLTFNKQQKSEITALVSEIKDWSLFVQLANNHGISALVCNNLKELGLIEELPQDKVVFLQGAYLKSLSRNTILLEKFIELQNILGEAGIEAVLIKGMALELTAWGNMGLRQMNDIDLYIEPARCIEAWNLLISKGYTPAPVKSRLHKKYLLYIGKHLPELYKDGISFEIHHKLIQDKRKDEYSAITIESDTIEYKIPQIEYHFLYLVSHLNYHENKGEAQVRQYMDLCQLMTQCTRDIKSSGILTLAKEYSAMDLLLTKFYQLHIFWNMPLPDDILNLISDSQKQEAVDTFLKFLRQPKGHEAPGHEEQFRKIVKLIPGFKGKFLYTLGELFPSLNFMKNRYALKSRFLAIFYYPYRIIKPLF